MNAEYQNHFRITGMANALPEKIISNADFSERFPGTDIDSFLKMAGISERRVVSPGQAASDLAVCAAERLFSEMKIDRKEIDTLIFCSQTGDYQTPATACILQARLGLSSRTCTFDAVQACPSFIHMLGIVKGLLAGSVARKVLLIHAEAFSKIIHPYDRGLVPLHGDGASVFLFERSDSDPLGIDWTAYGTDGSQFERICIPDGKGRSPFTENSLKEIKDDSGNIRTPVHLKMDGAAVFHFAIHTVPKFVKEVCAEHEKSLDDFDLVLFHQANKIIVDMLYNMLKIPAEKRYMYLEKVGNLSGVSLPFMLIEAVREKKIVPGQKILLAGFGGGMSWGAAALTWQNGNCVLAPTSILPR
ncbi:MAG: ketoacyl-ACP synthase III [Planctomycetia bacterium]|nr:ketoacyl-ACP synthase III [Planctomycetia bacterium]